MLMPLFLLLACLLLCAVPSQAAEKAEKPRLLVLTDIGGDPDDQQSMIRLMLYSNEFDIEGLVASSAGIRGQLKTAVTRPDLIKQIVEAYGEVRGELAKHAEGYPETEKLLSVIKAGNTERGRDAVGQGHDTPGSRWIAEVVARPDARPLNISIWGGQTDLAQALWQLRQERGAAALRQIIAKLRIYDIHDQDGIAAWMQGEFPGMFYILAHAPVGADAREGVYRGMYLGGDESLTSRAWFDKNVLLGHGTLGALYPTKTYTAPNPHATMKEGDTPSWFYYLPNGLSDPAQPSWGGWGGRFERDTAVTETTLFRDARDQVPGGKAGEPVKTEARRAVWRWREQFQNDFAARFNWCVPGAKHNHPPQAVLNGEAGSAVLALTVPFGATVKLSAAGSRDGDGDKIESSWFVYPEAGTYRGEITLSAVGGETTTFVAPRVAQPSTIHVILQVRDNGEPPLVSYRRAVITVTP